MKILTKKYITKLALTFIFISLALNTQAIESNLWKQFKAAKANKLEPTLPDFSYAGYAYSEREIIDTSNWPVFNVSDYGAFPDDGQYDDAGIQMAIDAAQTNGLGIVQFESGKYHVSPNDSIEEQIAIQGSNIVMKGQGSDVNGTIIFMVNMKASNGWTMFRVAPKNVVHNDLGRVVSDASRESFMIRVSNPERFKVGQNIQLRTDSVEFGVNYYTPLVISPDWTRLRTDGFKLREMHTVKAIDGNSITLGEPLHVTIKASDNINIRAVKMLENVGIEDIRFKGNWNNYPQDYRHMSHLDSDSEYQIYPKEFVHHHDKYHDYAWNALLVDRVHNGWVRNVEFRDFNTGLLIYGSSAFTVTHAKFSGKKGHNSVHTRGSYGVLVKDSRDSAGHNHGPSIGYGSVGAVYLRFKAFKGQHMDSHTGNPFATLFDNVNGNFDFNGGPYVSRPHHGKYLVAWNFKFENGPKFYDFWPDVKTRHRYALPFMVGAHGQDVNFKDDSVSSKESLGQKVEPESLFEAQLGNRLLPGFTYLGTEGDSKTFVNKVDLAFGAEGQYNFLYDISGAVSLNTLTFGDPNVRAAKVAYYRPAGPKGFFFSATENSNVDINSLSIVKFGANGNYTTKFNLQSDISCNVHAFGRDPILGTKKQCFIKKIATPSGYSHAANDGDRIKVLKPINVAFGSNGKYIFKYNVTSNTSCSIAAFGGDPTPGRTKQCYVRIR